VNFMAVSTRREVVGDKPATVVMELIGAAIQVRREGTRVGMGVAWIGGTLEALL
jgi:hypothetical protein